MQQPFLTGKQPILTGVLFLFLIPITKLYSSIWTQSIDVQSLVFQEGKTAIKNQWYDSAINDIPS